MHRCTYALAALWTLALPASAEVKTDDVFQAIRANDLGALESLLKNPGAANVRGRMETTPLQFAASEGSIEAMRMLIAAGADVNARNKTEATPLTLAAWDFERTKLLVEKGADVNAKATAGRTALMNAAKLESGADTVRYLMAKGADPNAVSAMGETALLLASGTSNTALVELLLAKGADVNRADVGGFTPLMAAVSRGSLPNVKLLLKHGANPNAANIGIEKVRHGDIALKQLTPLMLAAPFGSTEMVQTLIAAGAVVNAKDVRGMTPLMLAVATDFAKPGTVEALLGNGARVNEKSTLGETALDWAAKFKNPAVISLLTKAGAKTAAKTEVTIRVQGTSRDARESTMKAVSLVQRANAGFFKESGCVACHNQAPATPALREARIHGVKVDESSANEEAKAINMFLGVFQPAMWMTLPVPGGVDTVTSMAIALNGLDAPSSPLTDSLAHFIAVQQLADGSFGAFLSVSRAPMEESAISRTAWAVKVMAAYAWPGRKAEFAQRIARARHFLVEAKAQTNYEKAERLLGLAWAGAPKPVLERAARELLAAQRKDGGWSQTAALESDAYATSLALRALRESGMRVAAKPYRDGVAFLTRTQCADGSWYVASRAVKFQPYFESGAPHGHDQWISMVTTSHAVIALAPAASPRQMARKQ